MREVRLDPSVGGGPDAAAAAPLMQRQIRGAGWIAVPDPATLDDVLSPAHRADVEALRSDALAGDPGLILEVVGSSDRRYLDVVSLTGAPLVDVRDLGEERYLEHLLRAERRIHEESKGSLHLHAPADLLDALA